MTFKVVASNKERISQDTIQIIHLKKDRIEKNTCVCVCKIFCYHIIKLLTLWLRFLVYFECNMLLNGVWKKGFCREKGVYLAILYFFYKDCNIL